MVICANEKMPSPGVFLRRVRQINAELPGGHAFVSMSCNHCDEPACLANCPQGAYTKDSETGLVVQDHSKCIGCKTCVMSCPFHAPAFDEAETKVYKCDGCLDRQSAGLTPMCVIGCPSANIAFKDFNGLAGESIKDMASTKPNFKIEADEDIAGDLKAIFADIDGYDALVDAGCESAKM